MTKFHDNIYPDKLELQMQEMLKANQEDLDASQEDKILTTNESCIFKEFCKYLSKCSDQGEVGIKFMIRGISFMTFFNGLKLEYLHSVASESYNEAEKLYDKISHLHKNTINNIADTVVFEHCWNYEVDDMEGFEHGLD